MEEILRRYVRVKPKSGAQQFYRCGMLFTLVWAMVMVDFATAQRLDEEQMLEVSADTPVDYEGLDATSNADGTASEEPPTTDGAPADAPHTPVSLEHASPVDPVSTTGEGVDVAQASSLQAQAEAEARAQAEAESMAEAAAPMASKTTKAKKK